MGIADSVFGAVERFYSLVDARTAQQETAYPQLVCPPTCSDCCKGSIFLITAYDFAYLCRHVNDHLPNAEIDEIVALAAEQYAECGTALAFELESSSERVDLSGSHACPLLLRGRCRTYSARPTPCRLFGRTRFASGRLNVCDIIFRRLPAGRNGDTRAQRERALPVVETYSLSLASFLRRGVHELDVEAMTRLAHVSTIPAYIAQTEFDEDRLLELLDREGPDSPA